MLCKNALQHLNATGYCSYYYINISTGRFTWCVGSRCLSFSVWYGKGHSDPGWPLQLISPAQWSFRQVAPVKRQPCAANVLQSCPRKYGITSRPDCSSDRKICSRGAVARAIYTSCSCTRIVIGGIQFELMNAPTLKTTYSAYSTADGLPSTPAIRCHPKASLSPLSDTPTAYSHLPIS
jgi:hypothetical protein